jgi:hypothetical protein
VVGYRGKLVEQRKQAEIMRLVHALLRCEVSNPG